MSSLVIDHGNPWWLSPNVWAVPTSDPNEPSPGETSPVVNNQYFLVANVRNTSSSDVLNAEVYFWWANPSLGILTTANANLVGTSSVSVAGNSSNTSLELAPWTPSFVNNGHECLIAAVVEGGGAPPTILDGNNDPTVAQHNLGVINIAGHMMGRFSYAFQVCNPSRIEQRFTIHAERAPIEQAGPFLASLRETRGGAVKGTRKGAEKSVSHGAAEGALTLGFVQAPCPQPPDYDHAQPVLDDVRLAPFACTGFTLVGVLEKGEGLIHVSQRIGDRIIGGLSVLVLAEKENEHERRSEHR
jgi:hypothetical protein